MKKILLNKSPSYYKEPETALVLLSDALVKGYLSIFIGSGISKSATDKFPSWKRLVQKCCSKAEVSFDDSKGSSNEYLRKRMAKFKKACKNNEIDYIKTIKECLYDEVEYDLEIMKTDLLISLGSLVMGSIRGSAKAIFNYNYDDLLEWYLGYHGFKIQIISKFPSVLKTSDITIYHPHGFLPKIIKYQSAETLDKIIITQQDYLGSFKEVDPWNEIQVSILSCSLSLFVGLSGEDQHVELLCHRAFERAQATDGRSIIGYIILEGSIENRDKESDFLSIGLICYYIDDYKELPKMLLSICSNAAELK